jgi:hypothetical protein
MKVNSPLQQGSVPPLQPNVVTQIIVLCSELKLVLDKVQTCYLHLGTPALTLIHAAGGVYDFRNFEEVYLATA